MIRDEISDLSNTHAARIPFTQRLSCTIAEACDATGLGRTKLYELIGAGAVDTTRIGRRRLVSVKSLLHLIGPCQPEKGGGKSAQP